MKTPRQILDEQMSEKELLANVLRLLELFKWDFVYHVFDSGARIVCPKCDFPVPGRYARRIGEGFPDIIAGRVRDRRMLTTELKSQKGKEADTQKKWRDFFAFIGLETYMWRPSDWSSGEIERILR